MILISTKEYRGIFNKVNLSIHTAFRPLLPLKTWKKTSSISRSPRCMLGKCDRNIIIFVWIKNSQSYNFLKKFKSILTEQGTAKGFIRVTVSPLYIYPRNTRLQTPCRVMVTCCKKTDGDGRHKAQNLSVDTLMGFFFLMDISIDFHDDRKRKWGWADMAQ